MDELKQAMKEALATAFAFYLKAHNFHWNVEGPDFYEYHKLFQQIYEDVWESVDGYAENIRTLSSYAPGSFKRYSELSKIKDETEVPSGAVMVQKLLADNQALIDTINKAFAAAEAQNNQGLMNFLAGRLETHAKWSWFLRATTKKGEK